MQRFDKYWLGIVIGLILPAVFCYLYIERMNLWFALQTFGLSGMGGMMNKLCIVALFPNMALLFLFYTLDAWRLAKGIMISIFPYIILTLIMAM